MLRLLIIIEKQIKTTLRYHFFISAWQKSKSVRTDFIDETVEKGHSHTFLVGMQNDADSVEGNLAKSIIITSAFFVPAESPVSLFVFLCHVFKIPTLFQTFSLL